MVIYMKHPVHGTKVAISEVESEYDKTHGWEVYDPEAKLPSFLEAKHPTPDPVSVAKRPVKSGPKVDVGV